MKIKYSILLILLGFFYFSCEKIGLRPESASNSLEIDSISPSQATIGDTLSIFGKGFSSISVQNVVSLNGVSATVISASSSQLSLVVPSGITTGALSLLINGVTLIGPVLTFIPNTALSFSHFSTPLGSVDSTITVYGTGFNTTLNQNKINLGGVQAIVLQATHNSLTFKVPLVISPSKILNSPITIQSNHQSIQTTNFTYFSPGTLLLYSYRYASGVIGGNCLIQGIGFSPVPGQNIVSFGGKFAKVLSSSLQNLLVQIPAGASTGYVNVTVSKNGGNISGPSFYIQPYKSGNVYTLSPASGGFSNNLSGIALDSLGNLYVADYGAANIKKINPDGVVSILKLTNLTNPLVGPQGITIDAKSNLYISDNFAIYKVSLLNNQGNTYQVSLLAGSPGMGGNSQDGTGMGAMFYNPNDLVTDSMGNIYVLDNDPSNAYAQNIRRISPMGLVTTIISAFGSLGNFGFPGPILGQMVIDPSNQLNITVSNNNGIPASFVVSSDLNGTNLIQGADLGINDLKGIGYDLVTRHYYYTGFMDEAIFTDGGTLLAGMLGKKGFVDGNFAAAKFNIPNALAIDPAGTIYIADQGNKSIRVVRP